MSRKSALFNSSGVATPDIHGMFLQLFLIEDTFLEQKKKNTNFEQWLTNFGIMGMEIADYR